MLSVFASRGSIIEEANMKRWLDYVLKDQSKMAIKEAAVVYGDGSLAAITKQFKLSQEDFQSVKQVFQQTDIEKISFRGVTYCIKSRSSDQFVSFNGHYYVIASRSEHTYIIAFCQSRQKSKIVAEWINRVANKLRARHS